MKNASQDPKEFYLSRWNTAIGISELGARDGAGVL